VTGFDALAERLVAPFHHVLAALPLPGMEYEFLRTALLAALVVAPMCAALGVQVVAFRMAFFSDAVAHSAYTGVALGILAFGADATLRVTLAMVLVGVVVGLTVSALRERTDQTTDTLIGIIFSAAVALGLVIVALASKKGLAAVIGPFLIGDALAMNATDLVVLAALALLVYVFQAIGYNRMLLIGLNPVLARTRGMKPPLWLHAFAILLALVVTGSVRTVGVLVVGALLIAPAAAARNLARNAGGMFWWALALAIVSAVGGVELSIALKRPPVGAAMVICATGLYGVSEVVRALRRG
jgi:zinc transport system permease protein